MRCAVFDCDGVLVDSISSWRTLHEHFGTQNDEMLSRFISGELTDMEFMLADIEMWKEITPRIHRDELFRAFSGVELMPGAKELVAALKGRGVFVAIVSAGVDIFVSMIASMLAVDDWIANGFEFDEQGWLLDEGHVRVSSHDKGSVIERLLKMHEFPSAEVVCIGDSELDLSMRVGDCQFIGFNASSTSTREAFAEAGVPVVVEKDLRLLWPLLFDGEDFGG